MSPEHGSRAQARGQARADGARALARKGVGWRILHSLWILPTFALGLAGWVSFLYVGVRARRRSWLLCAAGYLMLTVATFVVFGIIDDGGDELTGMEALASVMLLASWFVPAVHAIALIPERLRVRALDDAVPGFSASGVPLAPPPGAAPGDLGPGDFYAAAAPPPAPVDLNAATAEELAGLPGMDPALARRAVDERARRQGFADAEDFGLALGLPPHQIARLRETTFAGPPPHSPGPPDSGPRIVDL